MGSRSEAINQAREAVHSEGSGDERALAILKALNQLRVYVRTGAEADTLREMQLSTVVLAGVGDIESVPHDDLRRLAVAWLAFEQAWDSGSVAG